ncbi:MAG: hypothetical protein AAGU78_04050 [Chloroflexota bacterium]|nr:hypothetical protein [Aggregatilineaceae bacterium]
MKDDMRERAWKAIFTNAFFSVESALIIALSVVLFGLGFAPFEAWQAWYWLVFGALAEALYLGVTISDPDANQKIVSQMLSDRFDPDDIRNPAARDRLKRAIEYQRLIAEAARRFSGPTRRSIETTADEVGDWVEQIYRLAVRLDGFEENPMINRDRRMVPHDLKDLQRRLARETDPGVRAELEEAIQTKETQLANLRSLENNIKRADIQLDHTLAALGTVYAQVQLIDARDVDSARTQRLQSEIREEVLSLSDTIAAIDEVQSYKAAHGG